MFLGIFLTLYALNFLYILLIVVFHWVGDDQIVNHSNVKKQMSSLMKAILKISSMYAILLKDILFIPSMMLSFDVMKCQDVSVNDRTMQNQQIIQSVHMSSDLVCWNSFHLVLVILALLMIIQVVMVQGLHILFFNDSYQDANIPWSQQTIKPQIIKALIQFAYPIWLTLDPNHNLCIVINILVLLLALTILFIRILAPIFFSELSRYVQISIEVSLAWIILNTIIVSLMKTSMDAVSCVITVIVDICLIFLFVILMNYQIKRTLTKGIKGIKNVNDFQINMFYLCDLKIKNFFYSTHYMYLQGLYQIHIMYCFDPNCVCIQQKIQVYQNSENIDTVKNTVEYMKNGESSSTHYKKKKLGSAFDLSSMKMKSHKILQQKYIERFQLKKSQTIQAKKPSKDSEKHRSSNHLMDEQDDPRKQFTHHQWFEFLRYQFANSMRKISQSVNFHMINSNFYFQTMKNEFKSLFELLIAEQKRPKANEAFLIYRMRKRIERVIYSKHEKSTSQGKKINVLTLYQYEQSLTYFSHLIQRSTLQSIKFWTELLDKELNVIKLHQIGIGISQNHHKITKLANTLMITYPNHIQMLLNYSRYLNDIINNEFNAIDILSKALQQNLNLRGRQRLGLTDNEETLFGENSFCCIFVVSTDYKTMGLIEYVNEEVFNLIGYKPQQLVGKDINIIIPKQIAKVHTKLMIQFFEKAESSVLNKIRELFTKDRDGYLVPIYLLSKLIPTLQNGLKLIGMIKKIPQLTMGPQCPVDFNKMPQDYILCDSENNIQNITHGITIDFGLLPKMFLNYNGNSLFDTDISIDLISPDFSDKEADLKTLGGMVTIDTRNLLEKVDREILSNEELHYFMQKSQPVRVFAQLIELSFSGIVTVKLYRIIQVMKFSSTLIRDTSLVSGGIDPDDKSQHSLQLGSVGSRSSGTSTALSIDRQLKDFKKKITENQEHSHIKHLRRLLYSVMLIVTVSSSLVFYMNTSGTQQAKHRLESCLTEVKRYSEFVQLQVNLRSLLNIANGIESHQPDQDWPYKDRFAYLNKISSSQIEDFRLLSNSINGNQHDAIAVSELDMFGKTYTYQIDFEQALNLYIAKVVDIIGKEQMQMLNSEIASKTKHQNTNNTQRLTSVIDQSAYFILFTCFNQLLPLCEQKVLHTLSSLSTLEIDQIYTIKWLCILSILIVFIANILLFVAIQIIENNKVSVLSLYSEIKVFEVQDCLKICKAFYEYLNAKEALMIDNGESNSTTVVQVFNNSRINTVSNVAGDMNFKYQWERLNSRLESLRLDQNRKNIAKLKCKLATQLNNNNNSNDFKSARLPIGSSSTINLRGIQAFPGQSNNLITPQNKHLDITTMDVIDASQFLRRRKESSENSQQLKSKKNKQAVFRKAQSIKKKKEEHEAKKIEKKEKDDEEEEESSKDEDSPRNKEAIKKQKLFEIHEQDPLQQKIGKIEQFQKIKKRNWNQIIFIVAKCALVVMYFVYAWVYQDFIQKDVQSLSTLIESGYFRSINMNLLYSYFRERLIFNDTTFQPLEKNRLQKIYEIEKQMQELQQKSDQSFAQVSQFFRDVDSDKFCDFAKGQNSVLSVKQCKDYKKGLFSEGLKSAHFTFLNYYLIANTSSYNVDPKINSTQAKKQNLEILRNRDTIQAFFVAEESFIKEVREQEDFIWSDSVSQYFQFIYDLQKVIFIIFLALFFTVKLLIMPKIIRILNEDTWRSRGILNLVPNNIFKEMKQNSKLFKMLKI